MLTLLRSLLTNQPPSHAERWLLNEPPLSLEWQILHKDTLHTPAWKQCRACRNYINPAADECFCLFN